MNVKPKFNRGDNVEYRTGSGWIPGIVTKVEPLYQHRGPDSFVVGWWYTVNDIVRTFTEDELR